MALDFCYSNLNSMQIADRCCGGNSRPHRTLFSLLWKHLTTLAFNDELIVIYELKRNRLFSCDMKFYAFVKIKDSGLPHREFLQPQEFSSGLSGVGVESADCKGFPKLQESEI